ncbi:MAG: DUF998 domain-containing protein [Nitrososphaera sp.]|uniref:DUF998 domain-containing protein n=1 Tax=Nitrososphaera sp. TaxID=1971748 RepID=UPI003D6F2C68
MAGSITIVITISSAIAASPWFAWTDHALSDLGRDGRASAPIFNIGIIVSGILAFVFALGVLDASRVRLGRVGGIVLCIATTGLIGIGVFPLPDPLHNISGLILWTLLPAALSIIGRALMQTGKRRLGLGTAAAAVVTGIFGGITIAIAAQGNPAIAIPEAIVMAAAIVWIFIVSIKLVRCTMWHWEHSHGAAES